ncbi:helix-turn-helix domain-containing protein [Geobacter sp. FeAm09]|uniref:helix-turn-helix domain-containing protein n=1 Tax=Geobacter sp. FeAm09 TaxID=2597769 RepID=UPI001F0D3F15
MSYTHLTEKGRYVISHLRLAKFSLREIARRLGRGGIPGIAYLTHNLVSCPQNSYYLKLPRSFNLEMIISASASSIDVPKRKVFAP